MLRMFLLEAPLNPTSGASLFLGHQDDLDAVGVAQPQQYGLRNPGAAQAEPQPGVSLEEPGHRGVDPDEGGAGRVVVSFEAIGVGQARQVVIWALANRGQERGGLVGSHGVRLGSMVEHLSSARAESPSRSVIGELYGSV